MQPLAAIKQKSMRKLFLIYFIFFPFLGFTQDELFSKQDIDSGPLLYRYSTRIVLDTLVKADFFELYFTLSDMKIVINEKKNNTEYNLLDSTLFKIKKKLSLLQIDTSKFIISTIKSYDSANNNLTKSLNKRTKTYRIIVPSNCDMESIMECSEIYGFICLKTKVILDISKEQIENYLTKRAIQKADYLANNYATNQKLKIKTREKLSEYFNYSQNTENDWNHSSSMPNETDINVDNIKYTIYMNITYVFE